MRQAFVAAAVLVSLASIAWGQSGIIEHTGELHISSSNSGSSVFTGVNINALLGGDRFYNAGYTGTRAMIGNIEAGHVQSSHNTLGHVTTQVTGTGALGSIDSHATRVTSAMAGRDSGGFGPYPTQYFERGMAPGATTYSGAIATSFGSGGSFSLSFASTASVYSTMIQTGVGGNTVDVFNSSWGFTNPTGIGTLTRGVDGLVNTNGTVSVFSAGNSGSGTNTVGGIGAGYNSITVGALRTDTDSTVYDRLSSFSSRSPNDFAPATGTNSYGTTIAGVRAAVDITAPGQNLTLASSSGGNNYNINQAGTSFSAPLVAGGAALVVDSGLDAFSGNANAIDGRIVKAVLLNSADKIAGWTNNLTNVGGTLETTQALDWNSGAGRMNLDMTYDQYLDVASGGMAGTTDLMSGDTVSHVGWDYGMVGVGGSNSYFIDTQLEGGTNFAATLAWFADRNSGSTANFSGNGEQHLANLDLYFFRFDNLTNRNILGITARSISLYNVVEHLWFDIAATGYYGLRVDYTNSHWNFTGETGETYGLAWFGTAASTSSAVPEPGSLALAIFAVPAGLFFRNRRKRKQAKATGETVAA